MSAVTVPPDEDGEAEIEASKAPLMDHLIELRSRLIKAVSAYLLAFFLCFYFSRDIYNVLTGPFVHVVGAENAKLIATHFLEQFFTNLKLSMFGALLSISIPSFISGPFLIAIFALWLGWLPVGGWGTVSQMILPSLCLAAPYIAYVARLMRNSLLDVLKSDFLRTARAKGLTETQAVVRHAVKVAILPVVTFLGPLAAHLLTGSMIVESVFNISGAGMIFVNSIQNRDVFLLGGAVIVYCVLLVLFNLFVDVIYTLLDKRIKLYA